ncbi:MAG: hypothetical protein GYA24_10205 [Candidatus Lokiarchaeota archaeon]|nr:hypothetical protein [Candidatus Lokiarchaeota archaeon]
MNVTKPMTQAYPTLGALLLDLPEPRHHCFSCQEPVTIQELGFVDYLIEHSPCFQDISENFAHCTGDESLFHDNVVNCCAACYAAIVQTVAPCEDVMRRAEIGNLVAALRSNAIIPAGAIIALERLLENLIAIGPEPDLFHDEIAEALYCKTSPLHQRLT